MSQSTRWEQPGALLLCLVVTRWNFGTSCLILNQAAWHAKNGKTPLGIEGSHPTEACGGQGSNRGA